MEVIGVTNFRFSTPPDMDWEQVFSGLLAFCLLGLGLFVAFLLLLHLSSILPIRFELVSGPQQDNFLQKLSYKLVLCIDFGMIPNYSILPISPSTYFLRRTLITHLRGLLYLTIAVCASAQV